MRMGGRFREYQAKTGVATLEKVWWLPCRPTRGWYQRGDYEGDTHDLSLLLLR